jgi:hypothetical protein
LPAPGILFSIAFAFLLLPLGREPGRPAEGVTHFPSARRAMIRALSDHPAASLEALAERPIVSGTARPPGPCAVPVPSIASPK